MTECQLCSNLALQESVETWNQPLFESPNFVVLPSLGALIEGWLLLVPKNHFICMGALPDSLASEMQEMKYLISSILQQHYGEVCIFEHGPSKAHISVGCGVDHAHIHFVPLTFDLGSAATPFLPEGIHWLESGFDGCKAAFSRGEDYLYFEQPVGYGYIAKHNGFASQVFRRAIASSIGFPDQFSWREHPQFTNVFATIDKLQAQSETVLSCKNLPKVAA